MTIQYLNRARMSVSGTPGTGAITLGSAQTGFQTFASAGMTNGNTVSYLVEDGNNWEVGVGTYSSSGPTLTRTTITQTSAGGASPLTLSSASIVTATILATDIGGSSTLAGLGDVSLSGLANNNLLYYNSGASKWENETPSAMIDSIGSTQGDVLYRDSSGWAALAPGTAGNVLSTGGASANPSWVPQAGGTTPGTPPNVVQFDYTSVAAATVPSVTMGSGPVNGNMLIAFVITDGSAPSVGSGWTLQSGQSTGLWYFQIYTKTAGASEPTTQSPVTGGSSSHWTIAVYEVHNQNGSTPIVAATTVYNGNNGLGLTPLTMPYITSTLCLMSIVPSSSQSTTCTSVFGQTTLDANLSSAAGAHAAFGHTDSNSPIYTMGAVFSGTVFSDSGMIILTH